MPELSDLKITFLAGTLGQGGAERQLYYILKTLKQSRADIRLLCLTRGEFWEEPIRQLDIPCIWVGQSSSRPARLSRIFAELRTHRPGVVQSQHFYTNLYAAAAARVLGLPEIGALRNDVVSEIKDAGKILGPLSLRLPRRLVANSQAAMRTAVELGIPQSRLYLLRNVVDTDQFRPSPHRESGLIRIVTAGRLVEQKRFDRFLNMIARLRSKSSQPFKALIYGQGPLRPRLERQARELGLSPGAVEFKGVVADATEVYGNSDIFMLTSDWEGTPNVVLEAMSSGLPVVSTDVGDLGEMIEDEQTGYVRHPGDEDGLCDSLLRLIESPDLRREIGRRARQQVINACSLHSLPQSLQSLYQNMLL